MAAAADRPPMVAAATRVVAVTEVAGMAVVDTEVAGTAVAVDTVVTAVADTVSDLGVADAALVWLAPWTVTGWRREWGDCLNAWCT